MGYIAKLIPSVELVNGEDVVALKADDQVSVVISTPNEGEVEVAGKVLGIQLGGVQPSPNQYGPLFDGIATSTYNADRLGNFRDATAHYAPEAILVQTEEKENIFVLIEKIQTIEVTPANEDEQEGTVETPAGPTSEDNF